MRHYPTLPALLLAVGVAAHLAFHLSLTVGVLDPAFNDAMHRFGPGCDFFSIFAAGVKARLGESVYTIGGHVEQVPYAYAFRYAPVVAYTVGLVLSWFPALTAYGVWLCLCELALLRNIRLTCELAHHGDTETRRETRGDCPRMTRTHAELTSEEVRINPNEARAQLPATSSSWRSWCLGGSIREVFSHPYSLAALWLLFSPYYLELYVGQFTFITASLVFWAYLSWSGKTAPASSSHSPTPPLPHSRWGDLSWAAAVLLKMMPLLYLPLAVICGRWKAVVSTVAVLAGTSWLYFQRFPADWRVFTDTNADPRPTWHAGNQGLMALLYALSGEQVRTYLVYRNLAIALVGALLLWLTFRAWRVAQEQGARDQGPGGQTGSRHLLLLCAAASAGYLLCYKDVWEHHYVLLLPPLVLMALRKESPWLWLPPFLVSALPTLFALYDVPGIGYNEDPQRYWVPSVSLLHHAWKPVAPLWLTLGIAISALRVHHGITETRSGEGKSGNGLGPSIGQGSLPPAAPRVPRWLTTTFSLGLCVSAVSFLVIKASAAIREQRAVTREVIWPEEVFQKQVQPENCGPAALAAVCRHYGVPAREGEIARLAGTTLKGTSMLGLQQAAEAKGLAVSARRVQPSELRALPRPSLLFFHEGHFAVLTGVQGRNYYVADPSLGQRVWPEAYLRRYWRGEVLLLGPAEPVPTPAAP